MGNEIILEFSGVVKKEYREAIDKLVNYKHLDEYVGESVYDACFIPNAGDNDVWNKETGEWFFEIELKNRSNTYEDFLKIVPLFMESVDKCKLVDGITSEDITLQFETNIQPNEITIGYLRKVKKGTTHHVVPFLTFMAFLFLDGFFLATTEPTEAPRTFPAFTVIGVS